MAANVSTTDEVTFFQTPSIGALFDHADVYMMQDVDHAKATGNYQSEQWKRTEFVMNKLVDSEGRFSVWKFIPSYIKDKSPNPQRLVVEIWFNNEPLTIDSTLQPITDENQYLIPYKTRYHYRLSYSDGSLLFEKNYGVVHGAFLTSNVDFTDEFTVNERVGIQAVFNRVRQEVYAMYGFCSFDMPFELFDFSSIAGIDVLQKQLIEAMDGKEGLKLSDKTSGIMAAYSDLLVYHLRNLPADKQPYAHRNLALTKAWLGDTLAVNHLNEYQKNLKSVTDSIDYHNIDLFVKFYPKGIQKYSKLLRLLGGNLHWMVDAFTYNDLLCNVYEIEYPIQFLPLLPLKGHVKRIDGEVLQEGKEPVTFKLAYDKKGRIKSLDMNRVEYNDKQKNNVRLNTLHVSYKKNEYDKITCSSSEFIRVLMPMLVGMNQPVDKIEQIMSCKTDNVLGGFVKLKVETEESNRIALDIDGKWHVTGNKSLSRPHAALKQIATANGEKFPAIVSNNSSAYNLVVDFDDNAFVTSYQWDGYVLMEKNVGYDNYAYIKADSVSLSLDMLAPFTESNEGLMNHEVSLSVENKLGKKKAPADNSNSSLHVKNQWSVAVKYDEQGNWTYLRVGPYEVKRTITYQ